VNQVNQIAKFDFSGTPLSATGFTGGGLSAPTGIAIDGAGKAWIANNGSPSSITQLSSSGAPLSPATGSTDPNLSFSSKDAVDASGNLWVTNHFGRSVTEFIGAAAPVKTPLIGPAHTP
jgi:streptogramin lyase